MFSLILALFAMPAAHADECYEYQVCEEVCTDIEPTSLTLSASRVRGAISVEPLQHCEIVCDIEEYCPPEDPTNGGEGADYSEDEFAQCWDLPLVVDQIQCMHALLQG